MARRSVAARHRLTGLGLLLVVAILIYLAVTAISGVPAYPYNYVSATLATASNVVPHDDVRIDGARIGQVSKITYDAATSQAHIQMQLQPGHTVYQDATASVGAISALGSEYISLQPGTATAGKLGTSGIPIGQTTTPVEIDSILNILGPKQADAAAAAVQTLGQGVGGRGQDINTLLGTAPTLLPNVATTTATLSDPTTALVPLISASNLLASRFQGRTVQLARLLDEMTTTFAAFDAQSGKALQATINDAAPTLPVLTPALNDLGAAAGQTADALGALRPGLAALGSGTPDLRVLLRQGVSPLDKVPGVAKQAVPGLAGLTTTATVAQTTQPVARFIAQLEDQVNPLVTYLRPYTGDMTTLWDTLANGLGAGDVNGNWLPFTVTADGRSATGNPDPLLLGRCAYPSPGVAAHLHGNQATQGCP